MKIKLINIRIFIFILFFLTVNITYSQCAMCKSSVESNAKIEVTNRAQGLNYGILYLMTIPYILFGTLGYFWYKQSKKSKAERQKIDSILKKVSQ